MTSEILLYMCIWHLLHSKYLPHGKTIRWVSYIFVAKEIAVIMVIMKIMVHMGRYQDTKPISVFMTPILEVVFYSCLGYHWYTFIIVCIFYFLQAIYVCCLAVDVPLEVCGLWCIVLWEILQPHPQGDSGRSCVPHGPMCRQVYHWQNIHTVHVLLVY